MKKLLVLSLIVLVILLAVIGVYSYNKRLLPTESIIINDNAVNGENIENISVNTNNPFGISIAGFLSTKNYEKSLSYMAEVGAGTARFMARWGGLHWGDVEKQKGSYDWTSTDAYYLAAKQNNLEIVVDLYTNSPEWSPVYKKCAIGYPGPDMDSYLKFVEAAVERYDGDGINDASGSPVVKEWILGVELERGDPEWTCLSSEEYADTYAQTYKVIKKVNPNAIVVPAETNILGHVIEKKTDTFFPVILIKIKEKGIQIPIYPIHFYPSKEIYTPNALIYSIETTKKLLADIGYSSVLQITDMDVWIKQNNLTEGRKVAASSLVKFYVMALAHGVKKVIWAQLSDGVYETTYESGLISKEDSTKNLLFYSYKLMTEKLMGSNFDQIEKISEVSNGLYVYKFIKDGKNIWVVWVDNSTGSQSATITNIKSNNVKITEAASKYDTGIEITDYLTAFNTEIKQVDGGKIDLNISEIPVYIEEI